ncbi:MAG: hypothetical protein IPO93_15405 [Actinobacteria bacterium]|jgi:hypothetical protein|nr:hypothetical protein [Actinomycetota bacterium]
MSPYTAGLSLAGILDEIRAVTGSQLVLLTVLDERDGVTLERVTALSGAADQPFPLTLDTEWPWADGASCAMLEAATTSTPDFRAQFPTSTFLAGHRLAGYLSVPVLSATGDRVVAIIAALHSTATPLPLDVLVAARRLIAAAESLVLRDVARRDAAATARRVDEELLTTLSDVRQAQDQVGNSIAVVLGWLRLLADSTPQDGTSPGGIQIAVRRLEEAQASIAELLRRTSVRALADHASDMVNASAISRAAGRASARGIGPDVWVRANATHLGAFLADCAEVLSDDEVVTSDAWIVSFLEPGLVTTASLLTLHASGGTLVSREGTQAARWTRAVPPVTVEVQ